MQLVYQLIPLNMHLETDVNESRIYTENSCQSRNPKGIDMVITDAL